MLSKEKLILVLFFLFLKSLFGQQPTSYNYTTTDGLPSSETYDVIQDQKGYIWIATDRGVSRFDGYSFKNFTSNEGLIDNTVLSFYEDLKGRIWFHGISGRLCYYENEKIVEYKYNDILTKDKGRIIRSFEVDENDNIKLGTIGLGLLRITSDGKLEDLNPEEIPDGKIFIASCNEKKLHLSILANYTPHNESYFLLTGEQKNHTIRIESIISIQLNITGIKRKKGEFVIYGGGRLIEKKDTLVKTYDLSKNDLIRIFEDKDSCMWISLRGGGVRRYKPNADFSSQDFQTYLKGEVITCIQEDAENGIWLSSLSSGLFYIPSLHYNTFHFPSKYVITALAAAPKGDSVLLGFSNGIVSVLGIEGQPWNINVNPGKDSVTHVFAIRSSKSGSLISTGKGTHFLKEDKRREKIAHAGYCRSLIEKGQTFLGCGNTGILQVDLTSKKAKRLLIMSVRGDVLYLDKNENLWIGDFTGLYYIKDSATIKAFPNVQALSQRISGIAETEDGKLIVTTIGKGMVIIENNKIKYLQAKDGLASDIINCIAVNKNEIWLGTNKGICRVILHKASNEIRNYSVENGIPGNEISNITISTNYIWAITKKELFYFDPEKVPLNTVAPGIWIESVSAGGAEIDTLNFHDIKHDQFPLKINYIALSYKKRGNVLYRYKLKGLNDDWQYTRSTYVEFLSLPAGNYSFEISAQNEDGIWSSEPAVYSFSIIPPYWKTWWFFLIIFTICLVLISSFFYIRIQTLKKKNQMITDILNYKQQALLNQMNPHFIFNSLNSIQTFILTEEKKLATRYISKFARLMRLSLDNSRSEFIPLEHEIETMQLYLELEKLRFKEMFSYSVSIDPQIRPEKLLIPAMLIQPYIENCIKHAFSGRTGREGQISLKIYLEKGDLRCCIEDNGVGREETQGNKSRNVNEHKSAGMSITEERLKLISSTLQQEFYFEIIDKKDTENRSLGTIVIFALPHKDIL